ncbi:hypothetical protein [Neorhizobium sp. DAR64860/K0K1]|uniref:hypothetical protein n=1 Tax=Neorhizobium sp. DAR64860/K0K1 TaxID=3421955 RepID=UPI003D2656DB
MDRREVQERLEAALDQLASIEHERWGHWQRYMHSKAERQPDGSMVIPAELVAKWSRQMETPYEALTPEERESDKDQVRRYLPTIVESLATP